MEEGQGDDPGQAWRSSLREEWLGAVDTQPSPGLLFRWSRIHPIVKLPFIHALKELLIQSLLLC